MHKHKLDKNLKIFANSFNKIEHKYLTRQSRNNYKQPKLKTKNTSFSIIYWAPYIRNKYVDGNEKVILSMPLFSSIVKRKLLHPEISKFFLILIKYQCAKFYQRIRNHVSLLK